ncbi:hypothetical protein EC973_008087 [Apophysomyces ossiformis]|uniref:VOC domain-containing protein n=1 Tax=Apophysomyces ossiformis TaxID=679940 RepID=A0A8H7ETV6_9FUNG|nr:hypothetical protein EC973_008087 [Apophysomyces ossiformis]
MLGMKVERFRSPAAPEIERFALTFGDQKINLHQQGAKVVPMATNPGCGTADFCLITDQPVEEFKKHWEANQQIIVEEDVVKRTGARGPIHSIYTYDPDGHLIEVSNYREE